MCHSKLLLSAFSLCITTAHAQMVVEDSCIGQYNPLLWGNDGLDGLGGLDGYIMPDTTEIPEHPYCCCTDSWLYGDLDFNSVVQSGIEPETSGSGDTAWFMMCFSGPNVPYPIERNGRRIVCAMADFDSDGDVDQSDFGVLQLQYGERTELIRADGWRRADIVEDEELGVCYEATTEDTACAPTT